MDVEKSADKGSDLGCFMKISGGDQQGAHSHGGVCFTLFSELKTITGVGI
jgi:hypothetical protein